ncbi:hypothetical protein YPPY34_3065, partial [Yersinia pestis PY-34]
MAGRDKKQIPESI